MRPLISRHAPRAGRIMKLHRINALIARHLYLYRRSLPRLMEIFYWPFLDLVVWGFITVYLMKFQGQIPGVVTFFCGRVRPLRIS